MSSIYKCRIGDMNAIEQAINIAGSATRLAKILGVSVQAVCFWRDGRRGIPVEKCFAIERATDGAVTRRDLRPDDWADIWPELAAVPAKADVPHATEANHA